MSNETQNDFLGIWYESHKIIWKGYMHLLIWLVKYFLMTGIKLKSVDLWIKLEQNGV